MKPSFRRFAALLCTAAVVVDGCDGGKHSETAENAAKHLRARLQAEIKTLGNHDWAGEYYHGDGLGVNVSLLLAPNSGYLFEWHGCLGLYDRNYGSVTCDKGRIRLSFTYKNKRKGFQGIANEFVPVTWGERKYLIPSDDIVGFCNRVNAASEPRNDMHGFYLLRCGDEKKKVSGFPAVPAEYRGYLLKKPIEATIVKVGPYAARPSVCDWKFKDTPVMLDVGARDGLLRGMELHVVGPGNAFEDISITKVEADTSEGIMTQIGEKEPGPKVGWRLSTRLPWMTERQ
jgi:hypothetical protein